MILLIIFIIKERKKSLFFYLFLFMDKEIAENENKGDNEED